VRQRRDRWASPGGRAARPAGCAQGRQTGADGAAGLTGRESWYGGWSNETWPLRSGLPECPATEGKLGMSGIAIRLPGTAPSPRPEERDPSRTVRQLPVLTESRGRAGLVHKNQGGLGRRKRKSPPRSPLGSNKAIQTLAGQWADARESSAIKQASRRRYHGVHKNSRLLRQKPPPPSPSPLAPGRVKMLDR